MALRERGGFWYLDIRVEGVRVRRSTRVKVSDGKAGRELAEQIEAKTRLEIIQTLHFPSRNNRSMTLGDLASHVLREKQSSPSIDSIRSIWRRLLRLLGDTTPVRAIDDDRLRRLLEQLATERGRDGPLKQGSINRHFNYLTAALVQAKKLGVISSVPSISLDPDDPPRDRIWTREEVDGYSRLADRDLRLAILIGYWTGQRLGAVCDMHWTKVDLERRIITVPTKVQGKPRAARVPMHQDLVAVLRDELGKGKVFPRERAARYLSQRFVKLKKSKAVKKAGLATDMTLHDLRHSAATNLWEAGADLATIMSITGHRSVSSVLRYLTVRPEKLLAAVDRIPGADGEVRSDLSSLSDDELIAELYRRRKG